MPYDNTQTINIPAEPYPSYAYEITIEQTETLDSPAYFGRGSPTLLSKDYLTLYASIVDALLESYVFGMSSQLNYLITNNLLTTPLAPNNNVLLRPPLQTIFFNGKTIISLEAFTPYLLPVLCDLTELTNPVLAHIVGLNFFRYQDINTRLDAVIDYMNLPGLFETPAGWISGDGKPQNGPGFFWPLNNLPRGTPLYGVTHIWTWKATINETATHNVTGHVVEAVAIMPPGFEYLPIISPVDNPANYIVLGGSSVYYITENTNMIQVVRMALCDTGAPLGDAYANLTNQFLPL